MSDSWETEGNIAGNEEEPKAAEVSSAANAKEEDDDDRTGPGEGYSTAKQYLEQIIEWEIIRDQRWEKNEEKKKIQEWWKNCLMEKDEKKDIPELQIEKWEKRDEEEKKIREWWNNNVREKDDEEKKRKNKDDDYDDDHK